MMKTWNTWRPKGKGSSLQKLAQLSEKKPETFPLEVRIAENAKAQSASRLITLTHYKPILTSIQVMADGLTVVLSFLAGYWLWSLVGPFLTLDLYEAESLSRYYPFLGVTLIT